MESDFSNFTFKFDGWKGIAALFTLLSVVCGWCMGVGYYKNDFGHVKADVIELKEEVSTYNDNLMRIDQRLSRMEGYERALSQRR